MELKYLWDTNIVIYFLQDLFPPKAEKFIDDLILNEKPTMSAITEIELLCWKTSNEDDLKIVQDFINASLIIELEKDIKSKTAAIRRNYNIKLPDAIIAASAIVYDLTLISRNYKDFGSIRDLKLYDPYSEGL